MEFKPTNRWLNEKFTAISITNACNLSCGGCNALCGNFPKEKIFFMEVNEIEKSINLIKNIREKDWKNNNYPFYNKFISIYGGEPTLHPKWNEIKNLLKKHKEIPFLVFTNGHKKLYEKKENLQISFKKLFEYWNIHYFEDNIGYRLDYKDQNTQRYFHPTLMAPIDIIQNKPKEYFARRAQRNCYAWQHCETIIYQNKGYFCTVAGAMDHLYNDGKHGWHLNENIFDKTEEEIINQAKEFCSRCGWCLTTNQKLSRQKIQEKSMSTPSNFIDSKKLILVKPLNKEEAKMDETKKLLNFINSHRDGCTQSLLQVYSEKEQIEFEKNFLKLQQDHLIYLIGDDDSLIFLTQKGFELINNI